MLEDKIKLTDWEATNEAIEEQIARESYVQWLKENERKISSKSKKVKFTATATATTASYTLNNSNNNSSNLTNSNSPKQHWAEVTSESKQQKSPRLSPINRSPKASSSGLNNSNYNSYGNFVETGSFMNQLSNQFPPQMFGIHDFDTDGDILRQVIAQSQEEYLDSLKRKAKETHSGNKSPSNRKKDCNEQRSEDDTGCTSGSSPNKKLKINCDSESDKTIDNNKTDHKTESKNAVEKTDHKTNNEEEKIKEIANEVIVNDKNEDRGDELNEETVNRTELNKQEDKEDKREEIKEDKKEDNEVKKDKEENDVKDDKLTSDENLESSKH